MAKKIIPVGTVFGRLTVVGVGEPCSLPSGQRHTTSLTLCECGKTKTARNCHLINGRTRSCGCITIERATKHGLADSSEYRSWSHMLQRVTNKKNPRYERYGGRGIAVCESWLSFENFIADMGPKPSPKHSIDRINNDGNYEPSNCRWATAMEQQNNIRSNVILTFYGKTMPLADWSRISQVGKGTISSRLSRGWSEKAAVWTPPRIRKQK